MPRYWPARALPPYRHVPGQTPHPRTDPAGHSYGRREPASLPLTPDRWPVHEAYLFGADLFNQAYWWEAHEEWEGPWRATADGTTRHFLQGLVQLAAALIKWHAGNRSGQAGLWRRGRQHLAAVASRHPTYMGLDVAGQIACAECFFQRPGAPGPVLRLTWPS